MRNDRQRLEDILAGAKIEFTAAARATLAADPRAPAMTAEALAKVEQVRTAMANMSKSPAAVAEVVTNRSSTEDSTKPGGAR